MSLAYLLAGVTLCCTVIGIPFGIQCFKLAMHALLPFDHQAVDRGKALGSGCLGLPFNVLWLLTWGWSLALGHLFWALVCVLFIVTIPFASAHWKLALLALWPFGKEIV
jgi:uncharacterized membrane protein YccF (DUF307 family)